MNTNNKKRNVVEWAMHYRQIIILVVCCLVAFGIYSLSEMRKNEFPDFTIRQGIVVAAAPGNTAGEMLEQVAKPLEEYIFSYKEVRKEKTFSKSRDGIVYIQVQLNDEVNNKDEFWSKFRHGVSDFKSQLPSNVLALQVIDDFGDTSALLITMESEDKTYRELDDYMDDLKDRLRQIPAIGRMSTSGMQREQISVYIDNARLSKYGLSEQTLALSLLQKGFTTTGGRIKTDKYVYPIYVDKSLNTVFDVQQQIIYSDAQGNNIRLKDVARVVKEYPASDSYITNNGRKCLLLSVEMKEGTAGGCGYFPHNRPKPGGRRQCGQLPARAGHCGDRSHHRSHVASATARGVSGGFHHPHYDIHFIGLVPCFRHRTEHRDIGRPYRDLGHDCRQLHRYHRQLFGTVG